MSADDAITLKGFDHVEFWVGTAKQAAHFYDKAFGFTPVAAVPGLKKLGSCSTSSTS